MRQQLSLEMSNLEVATVMSDGHAEAMRLVAQMTRAHRHVSLLYADELGIRGRALCVAYSQWAKSDIDYLAKELVAKSPQMIRFLRAEGFVVGVD